MATSSDDPFSFSADKSLSCRDYSALLVGRKSFSRVTSNSDSTISSPPVCVVNTGCFTSISEVTLNRKRVRNRERWLERRAPHEILLRVKVLQFSCEAASYELVIKVIRTWNRKKKGGRREKTRGFTPYRRRPVRFTPEMRQQLPAPTYLRAERFIARVSPAGCRLHSRHGERRLARGELREEGRALRNFRNTEQAWTTGPGRILRILESIHYSAKTAGSARRKIEPPCVRHPFLRLVYGMADCACFISLVRIFPHDSLASLLFPSPSRSFRPTAELRRRHRSPCSRKSAPA